MYFENNRLIMVRLLTRLSKKLGDLMKLEKSAGELARFWNQILPSLLNAYRKLKELNTEWLNKSRIDSMNKMTNKGFMKK